MVSHNNSALQLLNVSKTYYTKGLNVQVLKNINLKVEKGKILCLMGPTGSGKTTLLKVSAGLLKPDSGKVIIFGKELYKLPVGERLTLRRNLTAFMFQEDLLIETLNVKENVELPLIIEGYPKKLRAELVEKSLEAVGLKKLETRKPMEVSGGERRKISLARCLAKKPRILFADEPTSNMDTDTALAMINLLKQINNEGTTIIFSTHDPLIAQQIDTIVHIRDGTLL